MPFYRNLLAAFCVLMFGSLAADCSCECWKGGYISGQFGYIWRKEAAKFTNANYFNTLGPQLLGSKFSFRSNGYTGGIAIGSNYQDECFIIGYELGALLVNQKKSHPSPFFPTDKYSSSLEWLANAKMRVGLARHRLFAYFTGGGYGILLLVTATSIAVIVYFARHPNGENLWRRLIAPVVAAVLLFAVAVLATANFDTLLGVAPDSPVRWIIPSAYLGVAILGVAWALTLKATRPHVYARIGLGAKAAAAGPLGLGVPAPRTAELDTTARREALR